MSDTPRQNFNTIPLALKLFALTPLRVKLFLHLAKNGYDFIHSDADAVWFRDPRPWLMSHPEYDLLFSQGTTHPRSQYHSHHFVLCAGFFLSRSNSRTQGYFEKVDVLLTGYPSDQLHINNVLLYDTTKHWNIKKSIPALCMKNKWVRIPLGEYFNVCMNYFLSQWVLRWASNFVFRLCKLQYIFTSNTIIQGRF